MSATPSLLLPERQRRLLGFMGIELYVQRGARGAPDAATPAAEPRAGALYSRRAPAPAERASRCPTSSGCGPTPRPCQMRIGTRRS